MEDNGYIQVYTGNGKGKSTAAFGLVLRAVGAGKKVFVGQFVKGQKYSEIHTFEKYLPQVELEQFGSGCFIWKSPQEEDRQSALQGLKRAEEVLVSGEYDVVVLDEANIAIYYELFEASDLIAILDKKHPSTEVIVTGRYAKAEIIEHADLVTEMREVKHYYAKGVQARKGIES